MMESGSICITFNHHQHIYIITDVFLLIGLRRVMNRKERVSNTHKTLVNQFVIGGIVGASSHVKPLDVTRVSCQHFLGNIFFC